MHFDDFTGSSSVQRTEQETAQGTDRNRSRSSLNRPIPYYCEAPDGCAWDDRIPYRVSVEAGLALDEVQPMGFVS